MKRLYLIISFFLLCFWLNAQPFGKEANAIRTLRPPKIDGKVFEPEWKNCLPVTDLVQYRPKYNTPTSQRSEVYIMYDNYSIYIAAILYDNHSDSILKQLGNRDDENLNADWFGIQFDTYNNQIDAYTFIVTAAGVQRDYREGDASFNAVWKSAVRIWSEGWCVEMEIPYSAIRFPKIQSQTWGLQLLRYIRRNREQDQWSLETNGATNVMINWGKLNGIEDIKPTMRLSLTPYLSSTLEHYPLKNPGNINTNYLFGGGMDLKYGINESHTLDVTLLPDFSQVQSDNMIKNLSAYETSYNENRLFFQEAVDLFQKGNLFYSRRIGRIPLLYYNVQDELKDGESIQKNPFQAKLLNAVKFSGRNRKGFAIGIFNAITGNTYATIEDSIGRTRRILTDPQTNYSIVVMDQVLKNNGSFYIINTNVHRSAGFENANVTGSGLILNTMDNSYRFTLSGALSQIFEHSNGTETDAHLEDVGYKYSTGLGKVNGKLQYWLSRSVMDNKFNSNDLGYLAYNNEIEHYGKIFYGFYEPFGIFRELFPKLEMNYKENYVTGKTTNFEIYSNSWCTLMNYCSIFINASQDIRHKYDYHEPRREGLYYIRPAFSDFSFGISSDYRKALALDMSVGYSGADFERYQMWMVQCKPIVRISNNFGFDYAVNYYHALRDVGYAGIKPGSSENFIYFGRRNVDEVENVLNARYLFRNDLSLNLKARHYCSWGEYDRFYKLQNEGGLEITDDPGIQADFSYNAFNIDLVFSWEFSPGSRFELIWKNSILDENAIIIHDYWTNLKNTFEAIQQNSLTIKLLYYIDYSYFKAKQ